MADHDIPAYHKKNKIIATALIVSMVIVGLTRIRTAPKIMDEHSPTVSQSHTIYINQRRLKIKNPSRAFPTWQLTHGDNESSSSSPSWCIHSKIKDKYSASGLIYIKTPKTGSTTIVGVLKRISRRHATTSTNGTEPCLLYWNHNPARVYKDRFKNRSFLLGSVRGPTRRALSRVFFEDVTRRGMEPTDDNIIARLRYFSEPRSLIDEFGVDHKWTLKKWASFQLAYNSMRSPQDLFVSPTALNKMYLGTKTVKDWDEEIVREILQEFDFIMVSERMDESLVVLQLLLGLDVGDILYMKSKVAGEQMDYYSGRCVPIKKPHISPGVQDYLNSDEWRSRISGDVLLYAAVNRCLDKTILSLGLKRFQRALDQFNELMKKAEEVCTDKTVFQCGSNGEYQKESEIDCEFGDKGCGLRCLDSLVDKM